MPTSAYRSERMPADRSGPGTPVRIYSELYITRPPTEVWSCFPDPTRWSEWSPVCRSCCIADGRPLETGSTLVMRLRILGVDITIRATVVQAVARAIVGWECRRFGVTASHTYRLRAEGPGTLISNEEILFGLPGPLRQLVRMWFASTDVSCRSLEGIRARVEQTDGAGA
jgi:hypothetical protein